MSHIQPFVMGTDWDPSLRRDTEAPRNGDSLIEAERKGDQGFPSAGHGGAHISGIPRRTLSLVTAEYKRKIGFSGGHGNGFSLYPTP